MDHIWGGSPQWAQNSLALIFFKKSAIILRQDFLKTLYIASCRIFIMTIYIYFCMHKTLHNFRSRSCSINSASPMTHE